MNYCVSQSHQGGNSVKQGDGAVPIVKRAFVFDTNFIFENQNLEEVVATLNDRFTVYVTQISIDERLSQRYLDVKAKYEKLSSLSKEYQGIAKIQQTISLDTKRSKMQKGIQRRYHECFGERIIPFHPDEATFLWLLDRVFRKMPPFISAEGASDKGLKDSLIWISLLSFFKTNGEDDVLFMTNDNGFRKNTVALCKEFEDYTGKRIEIVDNSHYKTLSGLSVAEPIEANKGIEIPDMKSLREKINTLLYAICGNETENSWGYSEWNRYFSLVSKVDGTYMETIFSQLKEAIMRNLFALEIAAREFLELDNRVKNLSSIPMTALEQVYSLYEEIMLKFPDYLPQFFSVTATIINSNYVEPPATADEDDLPF